MTIPKEAADALNTILEHFDNYMGNDKKYIATLWLSISELVITRSDGRRIVKQFSEFMDLSENDLKGLKRAKSFVDKIVIDRAKKQIKFTKSIFTLLTISITEDGKIKI